MSLENSLRSNSSNNLQTRQELNFEDETYPFLLDSIGSFNFPKPPHGRLLVIDGWLVGRLVGLS